MLSNKEIQLIKAQKSLNDSIIVIITFELGFRQETKCFKGDFYTSDSYYLNARNDLKAKSKTIIMTK